MWYALRVRHDKALRLFETSLWERSATELNDFEKQHGKITDHILLERKHEEFVVFLVRVD